MIHLGELLSAHLDGELTVDEARLVAGHLLVCGQCRTEYDDLATARTAVRSLPAVELPASVTESIPPTPPRPAPDPRTWIGAAAAVVAVVAGSMLLTAPPEPEPVTAGDLGAIYVVRASVDPQLAPSPRYFEPRHVVDLGGGE